MKKQWMVIAGCAGMAVILFWIASAITAKQTYDQAAIKHGFDEIELKVNQQRFMEAQKTELGSWTVTPEQFLFYKLNLQLFHTIQNTLDSMPDDELLLDNLLKEKLVAQKALELGITVEDQEVENYIAEQKNLYEQFVPENQDIAYDFMKNRIRITGLSEEEFWSSSALRNKYYEALLGSKLMMKLLEDGTLDKPEQFNSYKQELLERARDNVPSLEDLQLKIEQQ